MKQEDRFFRLMHAVDDDLLEEAMQPVRRRRHVWIPLAAAACLCIAAALAAVPIILVFLAFQRSFTQGITMGAVKG